MSAWQAVHFRLMQTLPVRTHERREPVQTSERIPPPPRMPGRRGGELATQRRNRIRVWMQADPEERASERDFADELGISRTMVQKHMRAIKAER